MQGNRGARCHGKATVIAPSDIIGCGSDGDDDDDDLLGGGGFRCNGQCNSTSSNDSRSSGSNCSNARRDGLLLSAGRAVIK